MLICVMGQEREKSVPLCYDYIMPLKIDSIVLVNGS